MEVMCGNKTLVLKTVEKWECGPDIQGLCLITSLLISFYYHNHLPVWPDGFYPDRSGGLQQPARVSALPQEKARISDMEKILPWSSQPQQNVLKQKVLEGSEVLHAFSACEETPNQRLKQARNLHLSQGTKNISRNHLYIDNKRLSSICHQRIYYISSRQQGPAKWLNEWMRPGSFSDSSAVWAKARSSQWETFQTHSFFTQIKTTSRSHSQMLTVVSKSNILTFLRSIQERVSWSRMSGLVLGSCIYSKSSTFLMRQIQTVNGCVCLRELLNYWLMQRRRCSSHI